jgi:beta-phosphoglucomutase
MPYYDAICFDFDGVLADSEPAHYECWAEVLKSIGIQLDWPTFEKYCIGITDRCVAEFFRRLIDPPAAFEDVWALHPRKRELFRARMQAAPPFSKEIIDLVKSLSGYKLALVSASSRSELEPVLKAAGIDRYFDALVCAEDVERTKPAPDPYLLAIRLLGAKKALAVEDSATGIESARGADLEVLTVFGPSETPSRLRALLNCRRHVPHFY